MHAWEGGRSTPHIDVVRLYESASGHDLLAALDIAHRAASGAIGGPVIRRPAVSGQRRRRLILDLVEKADGGDAMTGGDWDELTGMISTDPHICLRDRDAGMITHRLVVELCAAEGDGWARRQEALARLIGHPALGRVAIDLCDQLARDRYFAVGGDVLLGLDGSQHPDATAVVLRHLRTPVSTEVEAGARVVAAQKIRLGHFRGATSRLLAQDHASPPCDSPTGPDRTAYAERLAHAAAADVDIPTGAATGLVIAMLCDPDATARYVAIRFLAASPLRAPLARRIGDELTTPRTSVDGARLVSALAALGENRRTVERLACAHDVPAQVRDTAVRSLGHMPGDSPSSLWRHLLARRVGDGALICALGMRHQHALLREIVADPAWSPGARAAVRWWLRHGPADGPLDR
ncbi:hypothetical protein Acsp02_94250 [Actinoplanes sp. NBRC 103695]|nr:hypothetical protein Acsp02_94250 [Actinoplanes sp. NBRC 103695]